MLAGRLRKLRVFEGFAGAAGWCERYGILLASLQVGDGCCATAEVEVIAGELGASDEVAANPTGFVNVAHPRAAVSGSYPKFADGLGDAF